MPLLYTYKPLYRSPSFSAMPKGVEWDYIEAPRLDPMIAVRRNLPLSLHNFGIIATNRMLTADERADFELEAY